MKKYIIYSFLLTISLLGLTGCEKDSSMDDSRLTYYVAFELKGDAKTLVTVNSSYADAGVIALENGVDVTSKVVVKGTVNPNKIGLYTVTYSAVNADGFSSSISRNVFVYDPTVTTDISGDYIVNTSLSNRDGLTYAARALSKGGNFDGYVVTLTKIVPGFFSVNDFFGGFYSPGSGSSYSPAAPYQMAGYLSLTPSNTLELSSSYVSAWNNSLTGLLNGSYSPITGTVKWSASWSGYSFNVVLNKK